MLERICWGVLALVHLAPALALVWPAMLTRLYGVERGGDLFLLMQHRAALFGVVLIACIWAALDPSVRRPAVVATGLSMVSFLALWALAGQPASLRTIALADAAALPALAYVAWRAFGAA
jgi:hypothetical protein